MTQTDKNYVPEVSKPRKVDILTNMLNGASVMKQFENALAKSAPTFVASVIDLYNTDSNLQLCEPKAIVMEALKAAVLKLPINKALGYAYIIPFNNSVKIKNEKGQDVWTKVMTPTFQMGYKGYVQLAMRTGQYKTLNADVVYEGELRKVNKLTGEIAFDGDKTSDKIVGYFCYFELLNGFSKTLYMDVEQMAKHAKRYSKGLRQAVTVDGLKALANTPLSETNKVGWENNFHGMAVKTVIRNLLSKYGYLSIEMQDALQNDTEGGVELSDSVEVAKPQTFDISDTQYEDVTGSNEGSNQSSAQPVEVDPGY